MTFQGKAQDILASDKFAEAVENMVAVDRNEDSGTLFHSIVTDVPFGINRDENGALKTSDDMAQSEVTAIAEAHYKKLHSGGVIMVRAGEGKAREMWIKAYVGNQDMTRLPDYHTMVNFKNVLWNANPKRISAKRRIGYVWLIFTKGKATSAFSTTQFTYMNFIEGNEFNHNHSGCTGASIHPPRWYTHTHTHTHIHLCFIGWC